MDEQTRTIIEKRIQELRDEQATFMQEANNRLAGYAYAISELERLLAMYGRKSEARKKRPARPGQVDRHAAKSN